MNESKKPNIKVLISREAFNTLFSMLEFFVASEAQAGETFYSSNAAKLMNQFIRYGNFVEKKSDTDSLFIIYLYETEILKIMKMYNKYISVHQQPCKDYFVEMKRNKKPQS